MLSSVIYDLGKVLGAHCQLDSSAAGYRGFFDRVIAQIWAAFPNLEKYGDCKLEGGGKNRAMTTLKSFFRARLQQSFSKKNYRS